MTRQVIAILLLAIVAVVILYLGSRYSERDVTRLSLTSVPVSSTDAALSQEEFKEIVEGLVSLLHTNGPRAALEELRGEVTRNSRVARECHVLAHEIGHATYEKLGNFTEAATFHDEICNSGYLHGVIESHFATSSDLQHAMSRICSDYPEGKYLSWECFHGVGHGLMYFNQNDLPKSLTACENYSKQFERASCKNGVYMEHFNTDQKLHASAYLDEQDPFSPCRKAKFQEALDCYFYAPTLYLGTHRNDYSGAFSWCTQAGLLFTPACIQGVGSQAMKENIHAPLQVETLCQSRGGTMRNECIRGMTSLFINHYGALQPARAMCATLKENDQVPCFETIEANVYLFD